ncbi:hypothetical protein AMTRI_Chr06g193840 [Amborella trichopoda]
MGTNCAAWLDTKLHYSVLSAQFKSQSRELEWGCRREQEGSVKPPEQTPALACCRGRHHAERSHRYVLVKRLVKAKPRGQTCCARTSIITVSLQPDSATSSAFLARAYI